MVPYKLRYYANRTRKRREKAIWIRPVTAKYGYETTIFGSNVEKQKISAEETEIEHVE